MHSLNDIRSMLQASGELRQNIVRSLGSSTVALFAVHLAQSSEDSLEASSVQVAGHFLVEWLRLLAQPLECTGAAAKMVSLVCVS
jgi:hypothetical protein